MKKVFIFTAFVILILGSCKKDSKSMTTTTTTTDTTFSASIGGVNETFTTNITARYTGISGGSGQVLTITAFRGTGIAQEEMEVEVISRTTVKKGVYTDTSSETPFVAYSKNITSSYPVTFGTDISGGNVTAVTISSLSSTNVQGTFSGMLSDEDGSGGTQTVTNGIFNVNITSK